MRISKIIFSIFLFLLSLTLQASADTTLIKRHLTVITKTEKFRNFKNVDQLNETAGYIRSVFENYSDSVSFQEYYVKGNIFKNVIASFGTENNRRIIIGAHYDVCGKQEGADDNATGVVALLELARLLKNQKLNYRIDLVAYTLEEPPFFRSDCMGSYVHAKSMAENNIDVYGMIAVEMIGYFSDEKNSQDYPIGIMSLFYGHKGNYIALVKKSGQGKFARKFSREYKFTKEIKTKILTTPAFIPGIDFSDHLNYWKFGYSALMITDTAFYRNPNYHEPTDTMDTLNLSKMANVIDGIYRTILNLK